MFSLWSVSRGCCNKTDFAFFKLASSFMTYFSQFYTWSNFKSCCFVSITSALSLSVFWGWTTCPSASYVACSAVRPAPAKLPLSWLSCPQSQPTASCAMTVAADGPCTSRNELTGSIRPARRRPLSVSWHAPRGGTVLPACLSVAHPLHGTPYCFPMEMQ